LADGIFMETAISEMAQRTTEMLNDTNPTTVCRVLDTFFASDGRTAPVCGSLGADLCVCDFIVRHYTPDGPPAVRFFRFLAACLPLSSVLRSAATETTIDFFVKVLIVHRDSELAGPTVQILTTLLPHSPRWQSELMSMAFIQLLAALDPTIPFAQLFLVLVERNPDRRVEMAAIVTECCELFQVESVCAQNAAAAFEIFSRALLRRGDVDAITLDVIFAAVGRAFGAQETSVVAAALRFLRALSEVPGDLVREAVPMMASDVPQISMAAASLVSQHGGEFSDTDVPEVQSRLVTGLLAREDQIREEDFAFLELLLNTAGHFDKPTVELLFEVVQFAPFRKRAIILILAAGATIGQGRQESDLSVEDMKELADQYETMLDEQDMLKVSEMIQTVSRK
jgi:hypothetical protein